MLDSQLVVFDAPGPTFRDALHAEYKGTRPDMPEEIPPQLAIIKEFCAALGLAVFEVPGLEADDVLATLARHGTRDGVDTFIVTADKDLLQMVDEHVTVLAPSRGDQSAQELRAPDVVAKLGVPPEAVIDYLSLVGDTADNVPGVPGIGAKTAAKLLNEFGSLDTLYARLDEVTPERIQTSLRENRETALLSRTLITRESDAAIGRELPACVVGARDVERVRALCRDMNFRSLSARLAPVTASEAAPPVMAAPTPMPAAATVVETLTSAAAIAAWIATATSPCAVGLDGREGAGQTLSLDSVALADTAGREALVCVGAADNSLRAVLAAVADATSAHHCTWLAWNVKSMLRGVQNDQLDLTEAFADVHLLWASHGWSEATVGEHAVEPRVRHNEPFLSEDEAVSRRTGASALTLGLMGPDKDPAADVRARAEARHLLPLYDQARARGRSAALRPLR